MLVLCRRLGEKILIDPDGPNPIEITVVDIDRGKIRLGITCAKSLPIVRAELFARKAAQNKEPG